MNLSAGLVPGAEVARLVKTASLDPANPAGGNQIHSDEFAQQMGFEAALMPGPTLMAYLTELLISVYGEAWFEHGGLKLRFRRPVYNQTKVLVKAVFRETSEVDGTSWVVLDVSLEKDDGEVAVSGEATCSIQVNDVTRVGELHPIALGAVMAGQDLGVLEHLFTPEEVIEYAAEVADSSSWYQPRGDGRVRLHPTMLSTVGLRLLRETSDTGAVILTEQEETYNQCAWTGQRLVTNGRISEKGQRRNRHYIVIETTTRDESGRELVHRRTTVYLTVEKGV